jgi:alkylation response protein AidB-like acyl-CoA dehydrogenase
MSWQLEAEQAELASSVARLVRKEFGVPSSGKDIPNHVPREYLRTLAKHGFAGIALPSELGGQGGGQLEAVVVIEAAARLNPTAGDAVQALNFGAVQQIAHYGSDYLRERFLGPCLRGEVLTSIAMTEPEAGSSVGELRTRARLEAGQVRLTGQKIFTTHPEGADFFVVWARFGDSARDVGAVVVERDSPGIHVDTSNTFMSGEPYGVIVMDDCVVPAENILLDQDGFRRLLSVFNIERLGNSSRSLALGQAAFDAAVAHAHDRVQFKSRLIDMQGLQWRLAEAALKLESARLLLYRAAAEAQSGPPSASSTAMAKLACNRAGFEVADTAVQILGGSGYDADSLVNYYFRRTRGWMIAGGTVEQMLNRIARGFTQPAAARGGGT